jgi:hypothetical protein
LFKNFTAFTWMYMAAAFLSFLFSVALWFVADAEHEAMFVGLWVPSILILGTALEARNK